MEAIIDTGICSMRDIDVFGKKILLRLDVNSPIDPQTKKIMSVNRINKSLPTVQYLLEQNSALAIIAHQGDTLDYHNLIDMSEHAAILADKLGVPVRYIDDVCGPTAIEAVAALKPREIIFLGNLRYLTEEVSSFEESVKLTSQEMTHTWLVRRLAPLFDAYVNDAFAAAHRNAPSMVAFQELLPSAAGDLMFKEICALTKVMTQPTKPAVFVLGGLKISDAFGMMRKVLENGSADKILACGVTGNIMLMAAGFDLGAKNAKFIADRGLDVFIPDAKNYLERFSGRIICPLDLAYEADGARVEVAIDKLPIEALFADMGELTITEFRKHLSQAGTIFVNGPAGIYENPLFEAGTREIWRAIAQSSGYSVIGGGDTVSAAQRFIDTKDINYVCTAGGAMVRFLSGAELPLISAMKRAYDRRVK